MGQLGDGRLRGAGRRRRRRRRGPARPADGRGRVAGRVGARRAGARPRPRSGSRPGRRCPPGADAVVPVEITTPLDAAGNPGPRGRETHGPIPAACLVHEPVARRQRRPHARAATSRPARRSSSSGVTVTPAVVALAAGAGVAEIVGPPPADRRRARDRRRGAAGRHRPRRRRASRTRTGPGSGRWSARRARCRWSSGSPPTGSRTSRRGSGAGSRRPTSSSCRAACRSGPYDVVRLAFDAVGHINLWRVAVQPGKPFAFGRADVDGRPDPVLLFGLPGNPVSSFVTFELFVRPVIRAPRRAAAAPSAGRPGGARGGRDARARAGAATSGSPRVRDADGLPVRDERGPRPRAPRGRAGEPRPVGAGRRRRAGGDPGAARAGRGRHRGRAALARPAAPCEHGDAVAPGRIVDAGGSMDRTDAHARRTPPAHPRRPPRPAADGRRQRQAADRAPRRRRGGGRRVGRDA